VPCTLATDAEQRLGFIDKAVVQAHVSAIDRCNLWGECILSLVDLIEAGTVDWSWAAHLVAVTRLGASLPVAARRVHKGGDVRASTDPTFSERNAPCISRLDPISVAYGGVVLEGISIIEDTGQICYTQHSRGSEGLGALSPARVKVCHAASATTALRGILKSVDGAR